MTRWELEPREPPMPDLVGPSAAPRLEHMTWPEGLLQPYRPHVADPEPVAPVEEDHFPELTADQLLAIVPGLAADRAPGIVDALNLAMREAHIDTPRRQAAFLAQVAHETGGFQWAHELGSDEYFRGEYDGREDLGNTQPGDGPRFKGRGYIQITGRANYTAAGRDLGLDLVGNPQLAEVPENAARIAAWYWTARDINTPADRGDFTAVTRAVNGGLRGFEDRQAFHRRAQRALGAD